jgi:hypothetical protein
MFYFANPFNSTVLDVDLVDVAETLADQFFDFCAGAHHGEQLFISEEVQARVLGADAGHELENVELDFLQLFYDLFAVETENNVFRDEPDGVIEVKTLDEFAMGFAQFVKKSEIARRDVFFIGHVIVRDSDVGFFHLPPTV